MVATHFQKVFVMANKMLTRIGAAYIGAIVLLTLFTSLMI